MTEEQKQHYWAMFYCVAYTQRHANDYHMAELTMQQGAAADWNTAVQQLKSKGHPVPASAQLADDMLAAMVKRWPNT